MSDSDIPKEIKGALSKRLAKGIVATSWLIASVLLAKFGEPFFDRATSALGKTWLLQIGAFLLFSSVYFLVLWLRARKQPGVLARLTVVKGKGYSIDSLTGEPVCPRCTTDEQAFPMREQAPTLLLCWNCMKPVIR